MYQLFIIFRKSSSYSTMKYETLVLFVVTLENGKWKRPKAAFKTRSKMNKKNHKSAIKNTTKAGQFCCFLLS